MTEIELDPPQAEPSDAKAGDAPRDDRDASFGYRRVDPAEKESLVRGVFQSVADNYDLMNDLMSFGVHRIWKSVLIDRLAPRPGATFLDMAGGTGDVAEAYLRRAAATGAAGSQGEAGAARANPFAIVCDINHAMLAAGENRPKTADGARPVRLCADATRIPLPDRSVDAYAISFGIRNVIDLPKALREAHRVLRFGGRFACLEFSHPITEGLQSVYDAYSFNAIPWLGERVANDRESYQYLVESIRRFPTQDAFAGMIRDAGFKRVQYENLSGGVAALHLGWRL